MSLQKDQIIQLLKKASLRVTQSRLAVTEVLIKYEQYYLTPDDIYQKIQAANGMSCDQASVYRTLALFEKLGIVQRNDFCKAASRYKINDSFEKEEGGHKHFFKCVSCFTIEPFGHCFVSEREKELEALGYRNLGHHFEITGLCPDCAAL